MSDKIMFIPLDERPCNYNYPEMIYNITLDNLIKPPISILGNKKEPANVNKLQEWILKNLEGVSHLILSIDMLVYGGIIPSRIHQLQEKEIINRLQFIEIIKNINPDLKIFAYNLITRVPSYNSDDEEPDYYEYYGANISKYGYYSDLIEQELVDENQKQEFEEIKDEIVKCFSNACNYLGKMSQRSDLFLAFLDFGGCPSLSREQRKHVWESSMKSMGKNTKNKRQWPYTKKNNQWYINWDLDAPLRKELQKRIVVGAY